jgi:hypothetical protein
MTTMTSLPAFASTHCIPTVIFESGAMDLDPLPCIFKSRVFVPSSCKHEDPCDMEEFVFLSTLVCPVITSHCAILERGLLKNAVKIRLMAVLVGGSFTYFWDTNI